MKLLDYIRGIRKGKEANRLEKESMKDPFLADAMDGYDQVKGDHEQQIEKLRTRISTHTTQKRKNTYAVVWSIAACLVIGFGISTYFLFLKKDVTDKVFIAQQPEPITETDSTTRQQETAKSTLADTVQDSTRITPKPSIPSKKPNRKSAIAQAKPAKPVAAIAEEIEVSEPISISPAMKQKVTEEQLSAILEKKQQAQRIASLSQSKDVKIESIEKGNKIRGVVKDTAGEPIVGAVVGYTGTNIQTITNLNGEFSIEKQQGKEKLTARFIGYDPVEIPVDSSQNMLIAMNESTQTLNEVVVVGYGSKRKKTITGAISQAAPHISPQPVISMRKYQKYLKNNLIRPTDECKDATGEVTLRFQIAADGSPIQIRVVKGLCDSADKEAIRLIENGPKWKSGSMPTEMAEIKVKF